MDLEAQNRALLLAKYDLRRFQRLGFATINPGTKFSHNWHLDYLDYLLMRTLPPSSPLNPTPEAQIKRLIINVPPRTMKSEKVSIIFPAFLHGHFPHLRILKAAHSSTLAEMFNLKSRRIMASPWYQHMFPNVIPSEDGRKYKLIDTVSFFETLQKGSSRCTTPESNIIGHGGNYIFVDDPLDPESAESETLSQKVSSWFDASIYSRIDQPETDVIIHVSQRLSMRDLTAFLLEKNQHLAPHDQWHHVVLPARATETKTFHYFNESFTFKEGEMLTPRITKEKLDYEFASNPYNASGQYQQDPIPLGNTLLDPATIIPAEPIDPAVKPNRIVQSWDTAIKTGVKNDYSVCLTFFEYEGFTLLVNCFQARLDFPALEKAVYNQAALYNPHVLLIEDKGSGQQLLQNLRQTNNPLPTIAITPAKSKEIRAAAIAPLLTTGVVRRPHNHPQLTWTAEFNQQLIRFPKGKHDDIVDAFTQYVAHYREVIVAPYRIRSL